MFKDDFQNEQLRINAKVYLKCLYQGVYKPENYGKPLNIYNLGQEEMKTRVLSAYKNKLKNQSYVQQQQEPQL